MRRFLVAILLGAMPTAASGAGPECPEISDVAFCGSTANWEPWFAVHPSDIRTEPMRMGLPLAQVHGDVSALIQPVTRTSRVGHEDAGRLPGVTALYGPVFGFNAGKSREVARVPFDRWSVPATTRVFRFGADEPTLFITHALQGSAELIVMSVVPRPLNEQAIDEHLRGLHAEVLAGIEFRGPFGSWAEGVLPPDGE